jgi:hypothetical protein
MFDCLWSNRGVGMIGSWCLQQLVPLTPYADIVMLLTAYEKTAFTLFGSFSIAGVHYGTGRHFADLTEYGAMTAMKVSSLPLSKNYTFEHLLTGNSLIQCWFFCYLFYAACMIASKMSIGFFLLRITVKKIHIWTVYTAMFFSVMAGIAFFLVTLLQCTPVTYFWYVIHSLFPYIYNDIPLLY